MWYQLDFAQYWNVCLSSSNCNYWNKEKILNSANDFYPFRTLLLRGLDGYYLPVKFTSKNKKIQSNNFPTNNSNMLKSKIFVENSWRLHGMTTIKKMMLLTHPCHRGSR